MFKIGSQRETRLGFASGPEVLMDKSHAQNLVYYLEEEKEFHDKCLRDFALLSFQSLEILSMTLTGLWMKH